MSYAVFVEGLEELKDLESLSKDIVSKARMAINRTLDRTRTRSARAIGFQVNFTAQYLSQSQGRLRVARKATDSNLEGNIIGRHRPTSLARFARGGALNKTGVTVEVKPGRARFKKRLFLIKLRRGLGNIDTQFNMGLAIRLRAGETIQNKRDVVQHSSGLYLLYGPSVDQVFNKVRDEVSPEALEFLEDEFLRLVAL